MARAECNLSSRSEPAFPAALWALQLMKTMKTHAMFDSLFFFFFNVETAESTEAATQAINSHSIFSVQCSPVSWALCHVWTDPVTDPTRAAPALTAERGYS